MTLIAETLVALVLTANIFLVGLMRLGTCIRIAALQGMLVAILTIAVEIDHVTVRLVAIATVSFAVKGFLFPYMLFRAIREAGVRREIEPYVGSIPSLAAGIVMLAASMWLGSQLEALGRGTIPLAVPCATFTMLTGLFIVVTRRKALTQALGYLTFENGIYFFGVTTVGEIPALVEFGVLLDALVAVFVMGVMIFRINREFDHIDADRLSALKG